MKINYPDNIQTNERGTNVAITHTILPENQMHALGFKKNNDGTWSWIRTKRIHQHLDLCMWIRLDPMSNKTYIDILDDDFCQPYDYQSMLAKGTDNKYAIGSFEWVEMQMEYLQDAGILHGHKRGDYI